MFEEVKEMIDSTIYTNGRGEVTAQNINLAMQAIVEATEDKFVSLEQNGPASSGSLRVWVPVEAELTEEQKVENADTFAKLINGYVGLVYMIYQDVDVEVNTVTTFIQLAKIYALGTVDDLRVALLVSDSVEIALLPDGTVEVG